MALWIEKTIVLYDLSQIHLGDLCYAKHITWEVGRAGFVTSVTEQQLVVQYHPGIGNVTNHFRIPVSEAAEGQWEIRWSADLSEVMEYRRKKEENEIEKESEEQKTEGST